MNSICQLIRKPGDSVRLFALVHCESTSFDETVPFESSDVRSNVGRLDTINDEQSESAWEFRRLSRLGERMESWKRSELGTRGIRLS